MNIEQRKNQDQEPGLIITACSESEMSKEICLKCLQI